MTSTRPSHIAIAFCIALLVHITVFIALSMKSAPVALIEGGIVSVRLGPDGASRSESLSDDAISSRAATEGAERTETEQDKQREETPEKLPEPITKTPSPPKAEPAPLPPVDRAEEQPSPRESDPHDTASQTADRSETSPTENESDASGEETSSMAAATSSTDEGAGSTSTPTAAIAGNAASTNYAGEVMRHLSKFKRPNASGPGATRIKFTIGTSGELESIEIFESSGSRRFDRDALKFVERAAPFPPPPPGVNRTFTIEIEGS